MRAAVIHAEWSPRSSYRPTKAEEARRVARVGSQVWRKPSIRVDTTVDPRPGPDEVLIRIRVCGVCGSDRSMVRSDAEGYMMYPGYTCLPVILGHEFSGEVIEVGSEVTGIRVSGRLDLLPMVTARVRLEDVPAVLTGDLASSGGKTLVQPQPTEYSM